MASGGARGSAAGKQGQPELIPVCQECGKPDERVVPKPLCLKCYEHKFKEQRLNAGFGRLFRRQMRAAVMREIQLERWLTGRWPIVRPRSGQED